MFTFSLELSQNVTSQHFHSYSTLIIFNSPVSLVQSDKSRLQTKVLVRLSNSVNSPQTYNPTATPILLSLAPFYLFFLQLLFVTFHDYKQAKRHEWLRGETDCPKKKCVYVRVCVCYPTSLCRDYKDGDSWSETGRRLARRKL